MRPLNPRALVYAGKTRHFATFQLCIKLHPVGGEVKGYESKAGKMEGRTLPDAAGFAFNP